MASSDRACGSANLRRDISATTGRRMTPPVPPAGTTRQPPHRVHSTVLRECGIRSNLGLPRRRPGHLTEACLAFVPGLSLSQKGTDDALFFADRRASAKVVKRERSLSGVRSSLTIQELRCLFGSRSRSQSRTASSGTGYGAPSPMIRAWTDLKTFAARGRLCNPSKTAHLRREQSSTARTLSQTAIVAVDSLSHSCSGVNLSTSHQCKPGGHGTPRRS